MKKIYQTDNAGISGIVPGSGLCFGHSTQWALLMQKTSPEKTNPQLDKVRMGVSLRIQQAMELEIVGLYDKQAKYIPPVGALKWNPNDKAKYDALAKKVIRNKTIMKSVENYKFTLKAVQAVEYLRITPMVVASGSDKAYLCDIGGHWLGLYNAGKKGCYYFDPNRGLTYFAQSQEFCSFYNNQMIGYKKYMPDSFAAKHTLYELIAS